MLNIGRPWRIALLALAVLAGLTLLAIGAGLVSLRTPIGMTGEPCNEDGSAKAGTWAGDWAGLCRFHADNARIRATGSRPKAVFLGDSITSAWAASDRDLFAGNIVNRGIGGQASAQFLLRFQSDVVSLRPRIVHILGGINDIAGNAGASSPQTYQANIRAMVDLAEANRIIVILGTIPPADDFHWQPRVKPGPWVTTLNAWLTSFAKERNLILADYHAVLATPQGKVRSGYFSDGSHPGAKGYAAMHDVALRALAEAEARTASGP